MDITQIPFNHYIGLKRSTQPELGELELDDAPQYHNHLATVHAAAQFAIAEACSGEYLLKRFGELADGHVPVVRRAEVKYRKPANGRLIAKAQVSPEQEQAFVAELARRGRALINIDVQVLDASRSLTMSAVFEWYVQKMPEAR